MKFRTGTERLDIQNNTERWMDKKKINTRDRV